MNPETTETTTMDPTQNDTPVPPRNRRERRAAKSAGQADMRNVRLHTRPKGSR